MEAKNNQYFALKSDQKAILVMEFDRILKLVHGRIYAQKTNR